METVGEDMERLLTRDPPLPHELWRRMRGWYRAAVDHALPFARVTLERITAERVELYCAAPPPGENIPMSVTPAHVDNSVPSEEKVNWVVQRLWRHKSGGPSQMRAEHLQEWLQEHRLAEEVVDERGPD